MSPCVGFDITENATMADFVHRLHQSLIEISMSPTWMHDLGVLCICPERSI